MLLLSDKTFLSVAHTSPSLSYSVIFFQSLSEYVSGNFSLNMLRNATLHL